MSRGATSVRISVGERACRDTVLGYTLGGHAPRSAGLVLVSYVITGASLSDASAPRRPPSDGCTMHVDWRVCACCCWSRSSAFGGCHSATTCTPSPPRSCLCDRPCQRLPWGVLGIDPAPTRSRAERGPASREGC